MQQLELELGHVIDTRNKPSKPVKSTQKSLTKKEIKKAKIKYQQSLLVVEDMVAVVKLWAVL